MQDVQLYQGLYQVLGILETILCNIEGKGILREKLTGTPR